MLWSFQAVGIAPLETFSLDLCLPSDSKLWSAYVSALQGVNTTQIIELFYSLSIF